MLPHKLLLVAAVCAGVAAIEADAKHNIVYVMTDDQDIELGGLTPMPKIRSRLGEQGAVGEAVYIATPICCPSRTETFSGRLYTNVLNDNLSGCMHVGSTYYTQQHSSALVPALQKAGYMTGAFGKIINDQQNAFNKNLTIGWDWLSTPINQGE
jgi:N-acetylglucosamine-6-sulfatase